MKEKTVVVIGKGPSLKEHIKVDDTCVYVALNSAILACDGIVHYHFMNDFGNLDKIPMRHLLRTKNVVIPSYPHTILKDGREYSDEKMPARKFIDKYPQWFQPRFTLFDMPSSPKRNDSLPFYNVTISVAESAVYHMISLGYRNFKFIGVGDRIDTYSELVGGGSTRRGFSAQVRDSLERILKDNRCTYTFGDTETKRHDNAPLDIFALSLDNTANKRLVEYTYTVLNTNETYKMESGTDEFKFIKFSVPKESKSHSVRVCYSVDKSDFSRILAQRLGQLR